MTDEEPIRRRHIRARRSGMSFSSSGLSDSSRGASVRDQDDLPEDGLEDQEAGEVLPARDLNREVISSTPETRIDWEEEQAALSQRVSDSEDMSPQARLAEVSVRSTEYAREYRLDLVHRLLMRKIPQDQIAAQLGVSISTVRRDCAELRDRLRSAAKALDIDEIVGNSKGFYEEVQAMSMRAASMNNLPMAMRLAAMRTSLAAHNDMHRFFQAAGVYDVLRFRKGASEGAITDIQRLMSLTDDLLQEARRDSRNDDALGSFSGDDREVMDL